MSDFGISPAALGDIGGWTACALLALWFVRMLFTGRIATRREIDAKDRRIEAQDRALAMKDQTIADFKDSSRTSNAMIQAFLDVAKGRS